MNGLFQQNLKPRVLVVAPRDSYRIAPYIAAARKLDVDLLIASEGRHSLASLDVPGLQIKLDNIPATLQAISTAGQNRPFAGIIGTDDNSAELAVHAGIELNLPHNPLSAVRFARRKDLARAQLASAGVAVPRHWRIDLRLTLAPQLEKIVYPCVVKPVAMSASRGVIRADDSEQLQQAIARIQVMFATEPVGDERNFLLVEEFIPGEEVAVEGLLTAGRLEILAIFDKPEPLNGPYFEESYYITPSRHAAAIQSQMAVSITKACTAYGLREGPIHAECRFNAKGIWILEVAARTIGGLCGRLLRFGTGYGLEELVLMHALGRRPDVRAAVGAAGVLMIPIPHAGILRRVEGLMAARQVPYIEEVIIDVREGYELVPLPEGASYLGFIFASAPTPHAAEAALRSAHARLNIVVAPLWKAGVLKTG